MRGFGLLLAFVIAAAAMSGPRAAVAQPLPIPGGFELDASNGYSVTVWGMPVRRGGPSSVVMVVRGRAGTATYFAPADVTETSIQARFGELGEIDVSFQPSGRAMRERSTCGGEPVYFDSGFYEGVIDFRGEEGYTQVNTIRAQGDAQFVLDLLCFSPVGPSGSGPYVPGAELWVKRRAPDGVSFGAHKNRPGARSFFSARIAEKHDGIAVERSAGARARSAAFEYDPMLQVATVDPPPPFSGEATFNRNAAPANRWTGTLSVDFPGHSNVAIAPGPSSTKLVRGEWDNSRH